MKYDRSFDSGSWFLIFLICLGLLAFILVISPESRNPKDFTQFALILVGIPLVMGGAFWILKKIFVGLYNKIRSWLNF